MFQMKVDGYTHRAMSKWHKKYGEVVGLFTGSSPVVLISGLDAIREALTRDDFSGRQGNSILKIMNDGERLGIVNTDGEVWKAQRRFTLHRLRDFGFGKNTLESIAHEEIRAVFNDIDRASGGAEKGYSNPVCFHDILGGTSINILWHIISGKRYDHDDPEFKYLTTSVNKFFQVSEPSGGILIAFPGLVKIFPSLARTKELRATCEPLFKFLEDMIAEHKKTIDYDNPRDFTDVYLVEIEKQKGNPNSSFHEKQLREVCAEAFIGGTDTTFANLTFAILFLVLFPDAQKKAQDELDRVVGRERLPSLEDKPRLPYAEAMVQEILRISSVVALCVPHAPLTSKDAISFRGYRIPKGTRVLFNFYDLHHDPNYWDDPLSFKPERFLDGNENLIRHDPLLPFSAGKRVCPGETLARNNIFLIVTAILQKYTLSTPEGRPKPTTDPTPSFVLCAKRFETKVQLRS
ncbi:methyl farnesoate epoxidase-like isoform X2 [Ischnura elegans]|nr:methyl farnesoate epoxidase-like isoform X2 [Ischnura elegans]